MAKSMPPPQGGKTLKYKVTFTANGNLFYAIEVNEGQKISKPVNNPQSPSSELIFDRWVLNGLPFDFENTIISSDLNLIATFKEQSSELFNEEITFTNIGDTVAMAYIMEPIAGIDDIHLYDVVVNNDELGEILNLTFPMMLQPGDPDEGMPDMYQGYVEEETPDGDYYVIQFMYIPDGIIEPEEFGPDPIYGMLQIGSPKLPEENVPPQTIANTIIRYTTKTQYEVTYDFGGEQIVKSYLEGTVLSLQNGNLPEVPEIAANEKFVGYYHNNASLVDQSVTVNSNITINGMISEDYAYELYEHFNVDSDRFKYIAIKIGTLSSAFTYGIYFAEMLNEAMGTPNLTLTTNEYQGKVILYGEYTDWSHSQQDLSDIQSTINIIKTNITELQTKTTGSIWLDAVKCTYINFNEYNIDGLVYKIKGDIRLLHTFNTPAKPIPPVIDNIYFDKAEGNIQEYDIYNVNPIYANKKCTVTIGEHVIDGFIGKSWDLNHFKPEEYVQGLHVQTYDYLEQSGENYDYDFRADFEPYRMTYRLPHNISPADEDHIKIELGEDTWPCGIELSDDRARVTLVGDANILKVGLAQVTIKSENNVWADNVEVEVEDYEGLSGFYLDITGPYYDRDTTEATIDITLSDNSHYIWEFDNVNQGRKYCGGNIAYT